MKRVPSVGPTDAKIMFVGEAPGEQETLQGEPFVGDAGQVLMKFLERVGLRREQVFLTNLCKHRPPGNVFEKILKTDELKEGLHELTQEIYRVKPNVIVALGAWPLYYLTGKTNSKGIAGTGIGLWRGSVLPCIIDPSFKVVCSYHPSFLIRGAWGMHPIFQFDLTRARDESASRVIVYPEYRSIIDPDEPELWLLTEELSNAEWVAVDIETFKAVRATKKRAGKPERCACVGFADSTSRGVCLTYAAGERNHEAIQRILRSPSRKVFHYGHGFDIPWLHHFLGWQVSRFAWDTYVAASSLNPEFPKSLEFLTSIYTRFPYYKEERKSWIEKGDLQTLWEYNIKDCIATQTIREGQALDFKSREWVCNFP